MRTHPMVIIGGILQENPFFVPPDEFLRELRAARRHLEGATPMSCLAIEAEHGTDNRRDQAPAGLHQ